MVETGEILQAWKIISEKKYEGKFYRIIYKNSKTPIRASVVHGKNLKSVEFVFDDNLIDKKKIIFKETKGIKLDIVKEPDYKKKIIICIYLKNNSFLDTYLKLIEKIISAIYKNEDQKENIRQILTKLQSWRKCFEDEKYAGLSIEEQIGLFGELNYIKKTLSKNISLQNILEYWKGPEGGLHDFKHQNFLLEVKTFSKNKNKIRISNPQQLNYTFFKNIYLCSVEINFDFSGKTIVDLINELTNKFSTNEKLLSQFSEKLNQAGYLDVHKENYNEKFIVNKIEYYKVTENFPTILPDQIHSQISDVFFSINIHACNKFICNDSFIK